MAISDSVLRAIGRITVNFNLVESTLASAIWVLLAVDQFTGQRVTAGLSFRGRLDLFRSLSDLKLAGTTVHDGALDLVKQLDRLENRRNQVLHSVWASGAGPDDVTRIKFNFKGGKFAISAPEDLSASDLDAFADELAEVFDVRLPKLILAVADQLGRTI